MALLMSRCSANLYFVRFICGTFHGRKIVISLEGLLQGSCFAHYSCFISIRDGKGRNMFITGPQIGLVTNEVSFRSTNHRGATVLTNLACKLY